jgi:hypothetical protein
MRQSTHAHALAIHGLMILTDGTTTKQRVDLEDHMQALHQVAHF